MLVGNSGGAVGVGRGLLHTGDGDGDAGVIACAIGGVAVDDDGGFAGFALAGEHGEIDIRHDHGAAGAEHHGKAGPNPARRLRGCGHRRWKRCAGRWS